MAQKSKKDRAKKNSITLNILHTGTFCINLTFLAFNFLFRKRSLLAYLIFSLPCLIAEYILETTGRPKFDAATKTLKSSGEDLSAPGLTDLMFDIIWITWLSLVAVMIFGNWGWLIWAVIPIFGIYKGIKLMGAARGVMGNQLTDGTYSTAANRKERRATEK